MIKVCLKFVCLAGFSDMKNRFVPEKCKSFDRKCDWKEISGGQHHTIALDGEGE